MKYYSKNKQDIPLERCPECREPIQVGQSAVTADNVLYHLDCAFKQHKTDTETKKRNKNMNETIKAIIEAGENARNIRDVYIAESTIEYNKKCDILSDKLRNASDIKTGDTVEIIDGYRHKGKKARVHEVGFMLGTRAYSYIKTRYASAHVSLLKKDGSLSKVSPVIRLNFLRKI